MVSVVMGDKRVEARGGCSPLLRLADSKACMRVCVCMCTCGQAPVPREGASICIPFPGPPAIRRLQTTEERRARPGGQEPLCAAGPSCAPAAHGPAGCCSLTTPLFHLFQLTERTFDRRHRLGPHKDAEGEVRASPWGLPVWEPASREDSGVHTIPSALLATHPAPAPLSTCRSSWGCWPRVGLLGSAALCHGCCSGLPFLLVLLFPRLAQWSPLTQWRLARSGQGQRMGRLGSHVYAESPRTEEGWRMWPGVLEGAPLWGGGDRGATGTQEPTPGVLPV